MKKILPIKIHTTPSGTSNKGGGLPSWKWILMILFPPYGMYYVMTNPKMKWFIKIPIGLLFALVLILAVDQVRYPYRVEEKLVKEKIETYVTTHDELNIGIFRKAERQGGFRWKDQTHVVYRTVTTNGLFDFILVEKGQGKFEISGIYQTYPAILWKYEQSKDFYPTAPMAMLYFYEHQDELGELQEVNDSEEPKTFVTKKGAYRYTFEKNKVTQVTTADGEILLQQKNEYPLPEKAIRYFNKNQKQLGKKLEVYGYELATDREMYYVKTTNGKYRVDDLGNGNMELLKEVDTSRLKKQDGESKVPH